MANHKSALKRQRQSLVRRENNRAMKSRVKKAIKAINSAVEQNQVDAARAALAVAVPVIAKAGKGTIHKKNASRSISRLTRRVNAISQ
ncbi:MAG: 30S ribosomal protein S20 [Proteobacteria bacterium]|nr:30S ribosomal protein S20 [Pseudomonadota bacterium]MBU1739712.1 30S ribosomal protein S20 [Pseudomonadota bacterium]